MVEIITVNTNLSTLLAVREKQQQLQSKAESTAIPVKVARLFNI